MIFAICLSASPACWSIGFGYVATTPPGIGRGKLGESWSWLLGDVNPWTHEASERCRQNSESWILFEGFIYQNNKGFIKADFYNQLILKWSTETSEMELIRMLPPPVAARASRLLPGSSAWLQMIYAKDHRSSRSFLNTHKCNAAMLFISKAVQNLPVSGLLDSDLSSNELFH